MVLEEALFLIALAEADGEGTSVGPCIPVPLQTGTQETLDLLHCPVLYSLLFPFPLWVASVFSLSGLLLPGTTNSVTQNMPVSGGLKSKVSSTT